VICAVIDAKGVHALGEVNESYARLAGLVELERALDVVTKSNSFAGDAINLNLREASGELSFGTVAG